MNQPINSTEELNRRKFLEQCALVSTAAVGMGVLGSSMNPLYASEKAPCGKTKNKKPYLKLSLAAYSFNKYLPRNWPTWRAKPGKPTMTILDFIDYCASIDLDGCELTSYYFPAKITPEYIATIKQKTFSQGLDISGTAIGNDFCHAEGSKERAEHLKMTREWIDYSAAIGAPVIRIFAGYQKKGTTEEQALNLCVAGIDESVAYAAKKGVILALENHGGITATPEQLLRILSKTKSSPFLGVNFDSGNFRTADPYGDLEKIAPYAVNAQVKVDISPNKRGNKQPADLKRIVNILKQANYRGYLVLEYERHEDTKPKESITKIINELRELI